MNIYPFYHQSSGTWSYLVANSSGECLIIDPVLDFDLSSGKVSFESANAIIDKLVANQLKCLWILETHAHADHLTAADYLKAKLNAKTVIGAGITEVQKHFSQLFNMDMTCDGSQFDQLVSEGNSIPFDDYSIEIIETAGHTSDGIVYKIGENLFVGDTFFHPTLGTARCDFPGGDANLLYQSLQKILSFPDDYKIWLCHDYPGSDREAVSCVTVAEMKQNIHLTQSNSSVDFVNLRENRDKQLSVPKLLYPALQVNICAGKLPTTEDNGANYLKIPLTISED